MKVGKSKAAITAALAADWAAQERAATAGGLRGVFLSYKGEGHILPMRKANVGFYKDTP